MRAAAEINAGKKTPRDFDSTLPTARTCLNVTAILEAGRISLDNGGVDVTFEYDRDGPDGLVSGFKK